MSTEKMIYVFHAVCLLFALVLLQGCILVSDAKYQADTAMWMAKAEASKAWAQNSVKPLATFTTATGETFVVNNPNVVQPMAVAGEPSAFVQGADVILNSSVAKIVGGGWAAGYMLGKVQGNYSTGENGSMNVTQDSGNTVDVTTRHTEGDTSGIAEEQHDASDLSYTDNRADYGNSRATPTIVKQRDPIVVTQPAPTIITQPAPVIVNPVIVQPGVANE